MSEIGCYHSVADITCVQGSHRYRECLESQEFRIRNVRAGIDRGSHGFDE